MIVILCLFSTPVFYHLNNAIGIIAMLTIFVLAFQSSLGPICFNHPVETCLPSTIGPLNAFLWANCVITSTLGPIMMSSLGPIGTFIIFGSITFCIMIYTIFFFRDTTFVIENINELEIG